MIIVLNGPAASGKGTLARSLALHLGLPHYDFGLMFRAIAMLRSRYDWPTITELIEAANLSVIDGRIFLNGADISSALTRESAGLAAAQLASREEGNVTETARTLVRHESFVADGRTISQIYPDADWHFQIVVLDELAQQRRRDQGGDAEVFIERRKLDANRLSCAPRAILIDTTGRTPEQSLQEVLTHLSSPNRS